MRGPEGSDPSLHSRNAALEAEIARLRRALDEAGLGLGMMGGPATLVERLFDGFLDGGPTRIAPANDRGAPPEPARNPFAGTAAEARRSAERAQEDTARDDWWDERRARARD
ncbi:hypothetical protein [uncultured Methylobacterium sp.]|uniref:hypothetical protein n=1 Tax=uncultured Methylobacterium sp. TaxID=157278 RepID=UPI0035CB12D0